MTTTLFDHETILAKADIRIDFHWDANHEKADAPRATMKLEVSRRLEFAKSLTLRNCRGLVDAAAAARLYVAACAVATQARARAGGREHAVTILDGPPPVAAITYKFDVPHIPPVTLNIVDSSSIDDALTQAPDAVDAVIEAIAREKVSRPHFEHPEPDWLTWASQILQRYVMASAA